MRTRTIWITLIVASVAVVAACNSNFTSGGICGNVLFLNIAQGHSGTLVVGDVVTLQAQRGVELPGVGGLTCTIQNIPPASVQWTSSDTTVVRVQSDGTAHGIAPGTASVTATQGGQTASLTLTVVQ